MESKNIEQQLDVKQKSKPKAQGLIPTPFEGLTYYSKKV